MKKLLLLYIFLTLFLTLSGCVGKRLKSPTCSSFDIDEPLIKVRYKDHLGYVNTSGKMVLKSNYESIQKIENYFYVTLNDERGIVDKNCHLTKIDYTILGVKNDIGLIYKDNKYGYIDSSGKLLTEIIYDKAQYFSENLASVSIQGKWGYINNQGEVVIPLEYRHVNHFSQGLAGVKSSNHKYGFINQSNQVIIDFQYEDARIFKEGLAAVTKNYKWGFVNSNGDIVIDFLYDDVLQDFTNGYAVVIKNQSKFIIDHDGFEKPKREYHELVSQYDEIYNFKEGYAKVRIDDQYGFIDQDGTVIVPTIYDDASDFSQGLVAVKQNEKWGYINDRGEIIIPFLYDEVLDFNEELAGVKQNGKWGFIDKTSVVKIPMDYDLVKCFSNQVAAVNLNGKWGYISPTNETVIDYTYESASNFSGRYAIVSSNDYNIKLIDKNNTEVMEISNDISIKVEDRGDYVLLKAIEKLTSNEFYYIIKDRSIKRYNNVSLYVNGLAIVEKNNFYGFINKEGNLILSLNGVEDVDYFGVYADGLAKIKQNGKLGFINTSGNVVVEANYDEFLYYDGEYIRAKKDSKWGLIDQEGHIILDFKYDNIYI